MPDLPALRRVKPGLMHVTLAFLGQTPEDKLADVRAAVEAAASGVTAFDIEIDRSGRFPPTGKPRVIWLGIGAGAPAVLGLGDRVRAELTRRNIEFDRQPIRAHLTLARVKEEVALAEARTIAAAVEAMRVPHLRFRADAAVVFESVLSPRGPRYTSRASAPLRVG